MIAARQLASWGIPERFMESWNEKSLRNFNFPELLGFGALLGIYDPKKQLTRKFYQAPEKAESVNRCSECRRGCLSPRQACKQ